jgi:hypothetical protein
MRVSLFGATLAGASDPSSVKARQWGAVAHDGAKDYFESEREVKHVGSGTAQAVGWG